MQAAPGLFVRLPDEELVRERRERLPLCRPRSLANEAFQDDGRLVQAVAGVGFSDNTRERVTLEHRHLRPFGWQVQMRNKFELGRTQRTWEGELLTDTKKSRSYLQGKDARDARIAAKGRAVTDDETRMMLMM